MTEWAGRAQVVVRDLDPGAFAFVMATGIVSTGLRENGASVASHALLLLGLVGYVLLCATYLWRFLVWRRRFLADLLEARGFAFLTFAAASNVLAGDLAVERLRYLAAILLAVGVLGWFVVDYGVPLALIAKARRPSLDEVDGSWFLWVVSTQSITIAALAVAPFGLFTALFAIGWVCWGVGVVLYLLLAALELARLLLWPVKPAQLVPSYWVFMGAAAISVRSGVLLLEQKDLLPPSVLAGGSAVLWAFCTWLIPLLLALVVWRHAVRRVPLRYRTGLWSMVFPVGMYGVATRELGLATGARWLVSTGSVEGWAAVAVWAVVFAGMVAALAGWLRAPQR